MLLAHIRSAFALSNATYGSPRMTRDASSDDGITVGRHRVARLMRENASEGAAEAALQTNDRQPARLSGRGSNLLNQNFNRSGAEPEMGADISYVWTREGSLALPRRRH